MNTLKESKEVPSTKVLEDFLNDKHLQLVQIPDELSFDEFYAIGSKYELTKPILDKIKSSMSQNLTFTLNIGKYPQNAIAAMCQLCNYLYKNAFLEEYNYKKSPAYIITAKPTSQGHVQQLLNGKWFERYAFQVVTTALMPYKNLGIPCNVFRNIKIKLENEDEFELDLIALIGEYYYWIECKTSKYQQHIKKYSNFAKSRGFEREHSFMLLLNVTQELCSNLSSLYELTPVNITEFKQIFKEQLEKDMGNLKNNLGA